MFDGCVVWELLKTAQVVASFDVRDAGDEELMDAVRHLERVRSLVDVTVGRSLVELDAREACETHAGHKAPVWLAVEANVPRSVATQRLKVARALRDTLGETEQAVVDGRISWDHARVLAGAANPRITDRLGEVQAELIDAAGVLPFEPWRREVLGVAYLLDEDGGHDPNDDLDRNRLSVVPTIDGITHLSGQLTAEQGAVAREAIETLADELHRGFQRDHETTDGDVTVPGRSTLLALAFVELCRRGLAVDADGVSAPRPDVTVVLRVEDPDHAKTGDGIILPPEITRLFCCDADVALLRMNGEGVPLDLGRSHRFATPAQRRALQARDGGCVFPGCDRHVRWCDAHHVHTWEDLGPTDLDNLALLCRFHHGLTHRNGWTMQGIDGGRFEWLSPSGRILRSQRHHCRRPATQAA